MAKKITDKQLATALYKVAKDVKGADLQTVLTDFTTILAREHKLKKTAKYAKYVKAEEGIQEIEISSARKLDEKMINQIKKIFGNNVEVTTKIDTDLLGGICIKTEDRILDASLKTQLNKLKQTII